VLVVTVSGSDGGFFTQTWRWTSLALFSGAGAALLLRREVTLTRRDCVALGALIATSGWMLLSHVWSAVPTLAPLEAERTLVYAAASLAFLVAFEATATEPLLVGVDQQQMNASDEAVHARIAQTFTLGTTGWLTDIGFFGTGENAYDKIALTRTTSDGAPNSAAVLFTTYVVRRVQQGP
jgi:hypothetical protein